LRYHLSHELAEVRASGVRLEIGAQRRYYNTQIRALQAVGAATCTVKKYVGQSNACVPLLACRLGTGEITVQNPLNPGKNLVVS